MTSRSSNQNIYKKIDNFSYGIKDIIGKGFSSTVYKGRNDKTKEDVAIKVINLQSIVDQNLKQLLYSQICILKKLVNPHILKCHEVYMTSNNCYIITQYCNQGDLATLIEKKGTLKERQALEIMLQVSRGLAYIASLNLMHRDIKPANILLSNGVAKIGDFGFAKFVAKQGQKQSYNVGSPLYMSPKVLFDSMYNLKNDVWSFGVSLYEVFQGIPPWQARTSKQLKQMITSKVKIRYPISPQLEQLIQGCMELEEEKRPTAEQISLRLQKIVESYDLTHRQIFGSQMKINSTNNEGGKGSLKDVFSPYIEKCNENEENIRKNHRIIKAVIDYSRFIYKLYPKITIMSIIDEKQKQMLCSYVCSLLRHIIILLKQTLAISHLSQNPQQNIRQMLTLSDMMKFKTSTCYHKLHSVVNDYYQRYISFLKDKPCMYLQCPYSIGTITQILSTITLHPIVERYTPNDLIGVDFIVSLAAYNLFIKCYGLSNLYKEGSIETVVQVTPYQIDEEALQILISKKSMIESQRV